MPVRSEIHEGIVPVKVYTGEIEAAARQQLVNISRLPIVHHHVAAMPDVHLGIGATVGSVIPTRKAIIPAAVGVDIGCGMIARRLSLTASELDEPSLRKVFNQISRDVPVGFESHNERDARTDAAKGFRKGLTKILERHPGISKRVSKRTSWVHQLGTLGGGNHFIELCLDEERRAWVMLHSGSRGIGNIATIVKSVAGFWKSLGMQPFIFPAMGSHGAATAEGQADVLAHYGIIEETMGCPVRSSLDVISLGRTPEGIEAFLDRHEEIFKGMFRGTVLHQDVVSLRFVGPTVAVVETLTWISGFSPLGPPPGSHTDSKGRLRTRLLQVMVKDGGEWKITVYHNVDVKPGVDAPEPR